MARVVEVRVGRTRTWQDARGRTWTSAIAKEPTHQPLRLARLGLEGDEVGSPGIHGGPDQAILAYAGEHYPLWRAEGFQVEAGAFGENLVLEGLTDPEACIGDLFSLGEAVLQVSQPRQPCATLARHIGRREIVPRVLALGRGGWYFRVLQEGWVAAGLELRLLERPHPGATVARVLAAREGAGLDTKEALAMGALEALSEGWRRILRSMAAGGD